MIQILNIAGNSSIQNRKIKRAARRPHVSDNKYAELGICLSLICSFAQITQIKWATVSDSLRSLRTNEWLWANRSGCSWQISNCEQFSQVAHYKWANRLFFWANRLQKMSSLLKNCWLKSYLLVRFFYIFCKFKKTRAIRSFTLF